jgi:argininosuccinate lyase
MQGISFREAYKIVAHDIASGDYSPDKILKHTHIGSIGNLCLDKIKDKFDKYNKL